MSSFPDGKVIIRTISLYVKTFLGKQKFLLADLIISISPIYLVLKIPQTIRKKKAIVLHFLSYWVYYNGKSV